MNIKRGTGMRHVLIVIFLFSLAGCVGLPDNVQPVDQFEVSKYLGKWYEIARLDHSFERGLEQVSAEYSMRADGGVKVINRGYSLEDKAFEEAEGKAYFVDEEDIGYLKVSFFGPFYGSYVIFELDKKDYQYAFIAGPNKSYLWLLSRTPVVSDELKQQFIDKAKQLGFETESLIFVDQTAAKD